MMASCEGMRVIRELKDVCRQLQRGHTTMDGCQLQDRQGPIWRCRTEAAASRSLSSTAPKELASCRGVGAALHLHHEVVGLLQNLICLLVSVLPRSRQLRALLQQGGCRVLDTVANLLLHAPLVALDRDSRCRMAGAQRLGEE